MSEDDEKAKRWSTVAMRRDGKPGVFDGADEVTRAMDAAASKLLSETADGVGDKRHILVEAIAQDFGAAFAAACLSLVASDRVLRRVATASVVNMTVAVVTCMERIIEQTLHYSMEVIEVDARDGSSKSILDDPAKVRQFVRLMLNRALVARRLTMDDASTNVAEEIVRQALSKARGVS